MDLETDDFLTWATHSSRTVEELFGIELLTEVCIGHWNHKHGVTTPFNWEAIRLTRKNRQLDPAYKPKLTRTCLERTAEVLDKITDFSTNVSEDRLLRDISFARFCVNLTALRIYNSAITDWSGLANLPKLTTLYISDDVARDFRPIGTLTSLEHLTLRIGTPWPRFAGIENLPHLTHFLFYGNVLATTSIPALPVVRTAEFHHGNGYNVPLRSVADLPAMPELRCLYLENTDLLDGLDRFPSLLNLEIYGYLPDLSPLAANVNLTHLFISGLQYSDLSPLTGMKNLCRITLRNDFPPDLTPLAELPRLHQIIVKSDAIVPPELGSLNALCLPWKDEFCCDPPRKLAPLRLILIDKRKEHDTDADSGGSPRDWGDDKQMAISESAWFIRQINRRLTRILGKGWGAERESSSSVRTRGHLFVHIRRQRDLDHLPAVVRTLRQLIASCLHPWHLDFMVEPLAEYERDLDEIERDDDEKETFDPEREREEWEYRHQRELERREFLKRRYQHRLGEELGIEAAPEPSSLPTAPPAEEAYSQGDDSGPEYDLGTNLSLHFTLTEACVLTYARDRELAEMLLEMKAES
ncbi:MAG: hypothetical protein ABIT37_09415 [Luteolibacter sp.]